MHKSLRDNIFYSPSINLIDVVIDEVALEGLDGITLEALWQRLAMRLQITDQLPQALKEQIWTICLSIKEFSFYQLNEPRPPLVIYDRYEFVDPDLGTITEPDNLPDDIYEFYPIRDVKNGIIGSCKNYHTRKKIESTDILSLELADKTYGSTLVIVASQRARNHALYGDCVCPTLELNEMQYCFLERVGRSRYHGEVTQGKHSLNMLKLDPKTLFYHRKLLLKHKLITKQTHYQKNSGHGTSGSLLHLPRFYVERKPKMVYLAEKIIEVLKTRDSHLADYIEIKKILGLESSIKHLFKTPFFQRVVATDIYVPYRSLYPNAKLPEYQPKNGSVREKKIRVIQLIDPSIDINNLWAKDDGMDDEEPYELDTSNQKVHEPFLRQANSIVEQTNYDGISQTELAIKMGLTKLQARTVVKNLSKAELVGIYMNDMGRQRTTKYVSKKFEKNSNISVQFKTEMDKMKELTKKSNNGTKYKTPSTPEEFFYPSVVSNENNINSKNLDVDEPMEIEEKPTQTNRKYLFSIVNKIKKKYKLNKCGCKYSVTHENINDKKHLSALVKKSSEKISDKSGKKIKLIKSKIDENSQHNKCNIVLTEAEIIDKSVDDIRCSISDYGLSDVKNTGAVTYRILKRANMIIEAVKEHKVIDDITKLLKMINEEEEREGYFVKIDKKSLIRLLQKLANENLVKNIKLTLDNNGTKKILTFICDPSINVNHTVIQSAVEQARIKFCLLTSSKCKSPPETNIVSNDEKGSVSKRALEMWTHANAKIIPNNLIINPKAGKDYGYSPKFIRMKVMHQLMYHLIYDHPGQSNLTRKQQIEKLRQQGHQLDDVMEKEMSEIFDTQISWKMFIPPMPIHSGWPEGWALFCDILLRIPLSLYLKIYNVPFILPDLNYYIKNPIRQHYLIKDLPSQLRNALLMKRRYIYNIHEIIMRLCFIGLTQFGPQKLKEKDQVFIYLNRNSELMDTTSSTAGYHQIQEKKYPVTKYYFDKMQTVEKYWYEMWHICINTRLGGRLAVQGTDIVLEELTKKIEMIQTLKPRDLKEAGELDLGIMPGDKKGAAGIDSAFFSHLKRNWNWANFSCSINVLTDDNQIRNHNVQRKTHLSKVQNKPIKFTEFTGLKKVTGPTSININDIKETNKSKSKPLSVKSTINVLRIKSIENKNVKKQNTIVRRVLPRKRKTRHRVKYDDIDYSALQKMEKLRVVWSPREDNILLVCKVVMMYLAPNPRSQVITFTAVRDVLRSYSLSSYNKTSRACQRRLLYMFKQPQTIHSVALGVEEIKQNYFVNKRYGDIVEKIRKNNDPNEFDEKIATVFKNLVAYVAKKYYDISQTESKEIKYKPNTVQEFNLVYEINHPQKPYSNQGFTNDVKNTNDIHTATINSVIYSSMCCGKDRKSWAYQLFRIYQQYPEILLRNAMAKIRSDQMVSIKRNYVSAMKKYGNCMPMSSSQYQLSTAYIYKFQTKLPAEIYSEIQDYLLRIIDSYVDESLSVNNVGVQVTPPTGGMIIAIQECLTQNKLNFDVEIPDHVITLVDPKHRECDETFIRIAQRYQDILASLEQTHTEYKQPREQVKNHLIVDKSKNNDAEMNNKNDVQKSKVNFEVSGFSSKQSNKKCTLKREHWGWGSTKFNQHNNDLITENIETFDFNPIDDCDDCEHIQFQDGTVITITKEDIERSHSTLIDDSIHQAFYKSHTHLENDFLDYDSIKILNEFVSETIPMEVDSEIQTLDYLKSIQNEMTNNICKEEILKIDERKDSNFINDIIENMDCEIESSASCCKKDVNSDDVHKSCTRIALLRMREELNEDLPDSHHAHEYFVVSTFGVYYSLPEIERKRCRNPNLIIDDKLTNQILLSEDENYNRVVNDLKKFAVFPKDIPDYLRIKLDLEQYENIMSVNVDLIFNYVREKREQGATLRELKVKFYKKIGKQLYNILHHLTDYRLFLRSGVTEMHYIHYNFIDPWIIQSIRIMRLQREGLPPIPPGSVYVLNSQHDDKVPNNDTDKTENDNDKIDDKISSPKLNENNNSTNISNSQKNIRKNRRTCLLQTKDIYTAAKKLDLNTAEDIHVVIRPWIQIDGVINRAMLCKMLGAVLAHCVMYPGILLTQVQSRFVPALQPYHTRELVELLVKLQCLQFKILPRVTTNLFSNSTSMQISCPAQYDGSSAYDDELIIEIAVGAMMKFSTFLRRYQSKSNTLSLSFDSADIV
ncbi:hypothetical protein PV328_001440 [Microctonus aethiopoides]|uniref:General transcription factor 3C polypeptide 1 n=1 Tax=Microctonus aethiopoides TaxID=144406 RepID=A0AA39FY43_9HYME|nr:hypothetical protein PV328_001440 [Microctonus aethiopoides]